MTLAVESNPAAITTNRFIRLATDVLNNEARAIQAMCSRLDASFVHACQRILNCKGRVIVTGMGKSGHIAGKIAATMASTGTPAFYLHPSEASHGDLGMVTADDCILMVSNSGQTVELINLLPALGRLGCPIIALTGNHVSTIATTANIHIDVSIEKEACPLGLAPTTSTTVTLAMGDALAIALLTAHNFGPEDFARSHPAGRLGRRLLLRVDDIMHQGPHLPCVSVEETIATALVLMSEKGLGMLAIVDANRHVLGIFTDGDLRRTINQKVDIQHMPIGHVMTKTYVHILPGTLAVTALKLMQDKAINGLLVVDDKKRLVGAFNMLDMLRANVL